MDLALHVNEIHRQLREPEKAGEVLESDSKSYKTQIGSKNRLELSKGALAGAPARPAYKVKNINLPEVNRNINLGAISLQTPNLPTHL
uniref:Uncharacterized protein n=1 Tax=Callorhinchus milii TaxID=7868 RepID=A0A4W3JHL5_CALMI